ncbi:MAG: ATPase domain-containing protein [Candidatus Saliniplasma sp.]
MVNRIETGIYGVDQLIEGGLIEKSAITVVGASGTGKTTFAIQFVMKGIEKGEQALFVTLEESPEQIMEEAAMMGWDMKKHHEESLFFIHLSGQNFREMIEDQLPKLVQARKDYDIKTRVVIDPLTPVIWSTKDKLEQRELLEKLFRPLKELGTVMATVEEHSKPGEIIGSDVLLPIYLSDGVFHLEYYPVGGAFNRTFKIVKMRGTNHGEGLYPYVFVRGAGVIVRSTPVEIKEERKESYDEAFDKALETAKHIDVPEIVVEKIQRMKDQWNYDYSPDEILDIILSSYKQE